MQGNYPKATTSQDLLKALGLGSLAPRPAEDIEEQQVRKWQQEAVKSTRDVFARMRRHLDARSAATAGEIGHHELNQATTKRLALWADQERGMVDQVLSDKLGSEARSWVMRRLECGNVDDTDPAPKLAVWAHAIGKITEGLFCDANDDAIFQECLREAVLKDAAENGDGSDDPAFNHSKDFRSVRWGGTTYSFTKNQAAVVKLLWEAWAASTPDRDASVLEDAGVPQARVPDVFKAKGEMHPAWGTMITPGNTKGTYRLTELETVAKPAVKPAEENHGKHHGKHHGSIQ